MYTSKNDLISRLVLITGKHRSDFIDKTVSELSALLNRYDTKQKRTYLEVPYKDKGIVQILGAKYDGDMKRWYIPNGLKIELFDKWKETK